MNLHRACCYDPDAQRTFSNGRFIGRTTTATQSPDGQLRVSYMRTGDGHRPRPWVSFPLRARSLRMLSLCYGRPNVLGRGRPMWGWGSSVPN